MTARADAQRNRAKLLAVAGAAFASTDGTAATLEGIAREAGVGIGTLYRHFPTREALVEAVYAAELDDVVSSATALLAELPPEAALRAWMDRYAAFHATKRGMGETLRAGWASGAIATPATRERITAAIAAILEKGRPPARCGRTSTPRTSPSCCSGCSCPRRPSTPRRRSARSSIWWSTPCGPRHGPRASRPRRA